MNCQQRILNLLIERGTVPSWKICQLCKTADYRKRISEMRTNGLDIVSVNAGRRHFYELRTPKYKINQAACALKARYA